MNFFGNTVVVGAFLVLTGTAIAEPTTGGVAGVKIICPATGPGIAACTTAGVVLHELTQPRPFGPNGEVAKAAREVRDWIGDRTGLRSLFKHW